MMDPISIEPDTGIYRCGSLDVTPAVNDEILAQAYMGWKRDGFLPVIFYQGIPSLAQFMGQFLGPGMTVCGCFRRLNEDGIELAGLGWVNAREEMPGEGRRYLKAECGMGFFRNLKPAETIAFGRMLLTCFFDRYNVDMIYGTTPVQNRAALRWARAVGFSLHGPIPDYATWNGELTSVWISHMSKQQWSERRDEWAAAA